MIKNQYSRVLTVLLLCPSPLNVVGYLDFAAASDKVVHFNNVPESNENEHIQYESLNNEKSDEQDVSESEDDDNDFFSNVRSNVEDTTDDYNDIDVPGINTGNDDPDPPKADIHHNPEEMRLKCSTLEDNQIIHNLGTYSQKCQFCACFNNEWVCRVSDDDCPRTWCEDPMIRDFIVLFHHSCFECKCHPKVNYMICEPRFAGDNWDPVSICSVTSHFDSGSYIPIEKTGKLIKLFNQ